MQTTSKLRRLLIKVTGYWIYKKKHLPVGVDLSEDLKNKIKIEPEIIFDVGANVGQTAMKYAGEFSKARIFSFEPVSDTYNQLVKNMKALKRVSCYHFAFGEKVDSFKIKLFSNSDSCLNSLNVSSMNQNASADEEQIQVNTIDAFLNENKIEKIDLLKIDTEGFEIPVLKGAALSIQTEKIKLIYLEVGFSKNNPRNSKFSDVHDYLESAGYVFFGLYEISYFHARSNSHYGNALYVHTSVIKQRFVEWGG